MLPQGEHAGIEGQEVGHRVDRGYGLQIAPGLFRGLLFADLAPHEEAYALVLVPFAEVEPGRDDVVCGNAHFLVRGGHGVHLDRLEPLDGAQKFVSDVVGFNAWQGVEMGGFTVEHPGCLVEGGELGESRGLVAGAGAEVAGKLGDLGDGAYGCLGRTRGRAGSEDDFALPRERGGIPGYGPHGGQGHAEGEVFKHEADAFLVEAIDKILQDGIGCTGRINGGRGQLLPVDAAADVALHQLRESLQEGLLFGVAGRGAVEFAEEAEPVQREPYRLAVAKPRCGVEFPAHAAHDL